MSDQPGTEVTVAASAEESSVLSSIADLAETVATGIPAPIRKTFFKAVHQLCMAGVDVGVAKLEGFAAEARAITKTRVKVVDATGSQIAKRLDVKQEYVDAALENASAQIVKKRINLDKTVLIAIKDVQEKPLLQIGNEPTTERKEISDDWLNVFQQEAENMSSEHMQMLFGKILAGEIRKPTSFSIRTVRLMAQLDNRPAQLFRKLCSLACTLRIGSVATDSRVIAVKGNANSNGLQDFGLSFGDLNVLFEYGLIINDYNSYMMYVGSIAKDNAVAMPFTYMNEPYALVPKAPMTMEQMMAFKVNGVALTRAGMELLDIVEVDEDPQFTTALKVFFDGQGYTIGKVTVPTPAPSAS